jgi:hypothetical protein
MMDSQGRYLLVVAASTAASFFSLDAFFSTASLLSSGEDSTQPSSECDNIRSGYLSVVTTVFSQQDGIYGFKSPKRFLEISS